jgi:hypothetical protein
VGAADKFEGWETRAELLAFANAQGSPLSGTQLARMHRAELIARPKTRSLGQGRGKVSLYPPGTKHRLKRVLEVRREVRGFDDVAWHLWWEEGGSVSDVVRERLAQAASDWEKAREEIADLLVGEEAGNPDAESRMEAEYRSLEVDRAPASLGKVRRNVGGAGLPTVFRVLMEVATGRFEGYADTEGEQASGREQLFERAFGIDRARVDHLDGSKPWFEGSSEEDLQTLSTVVGTRSLSDFAQADETELNAARIELRGLFGTVFAIAPVFDRLFGSGAFGFGTVGAVFGGQRSGEEARLLVLWLALRENEQLREGMAEFVSAAPDSAAMQTIYAAFTKWREEIPAFAEVLSDDFLAAALKDGEQQRRFNDELGRLFQEHRSEVESFLAHHPELEPAIEAFEAKSEVPDL